MLSFLLAGAFSGLVSTLVMVLAEVPFWRKIGFKELVEWQLNWALVSTLTGVGEARGRNLKVPFAVAGHLFHGTVAGVIFSLVLPSVLSNASLGIPIMLAAIAYSFVLWIVFSVGLRRLYETRLGFQSSNRGLVVALLSHLVYGLFLGLIISIV